MASENILLSLTAQQQSIVNSNPQIKKRFVDFAKSNNYDVGGFSSAESQPRRSSLLNRQRRRKFLTNTEFEKHIVQPAMAESASQEIPTPTAPTPTPIPAPEAPKKNKENEPESSGKSQIEKLLSKYQENVNKIAKENAAQTKEKSTGEKIWNVVKPIGTLAGLGAMLGLQYKRGQENEKAANDYNNIIKENMKEMQRLLNDDPNADVSPLEKEIKVLEKKRALEMRSMLQSNAMSQYLAHKYNLENRGKGVSMNDLYDLYRGKGTSPEAINDILYNTIKM
ncbi:MAG: hypothetical protein LBD98_03170 [Endomicrobium sp.]|jgi:hypothetical protein|nr:hypothetical protein [Endomicrobium sp.]